MRFKLFATGECRHPIFLGEYPTLQKAVEDVAGVDMGDGPFAATWPEGHDGAIVDIETGIQYYVGEDGAESCDALDPDLAAIYSK
jgi:hypothetical protein